MKQTICVVAVMLMCVLEIAHGLGDSTSNPNVSKKKLRDNWIEGYVLNRMGEPLDGVEVRGLTPRVGFHSCFSSPRGHDPLGDEYIAKTGSDGHFRLEGLPNRFEEIGLRLRIPGWHENTKNYPVNHSVRIKMDRPDRVIKGFVVDDETDEPVQYFSVSVYGKHKTFSDSEGVFVIGGLWPYRYGRVFVDAEGYQQTIARDIVAEPEKSASLHTIRIRKGKDLEGILVDVRTGQALSAVPILYGFIRDSGYYHWADSHNYDHNTGSISGVQRGATNEKGKFNFHEAADERGTLFIIHDNYARLILRAEQRKIDPSTGLLRVELEPGASISGLLVKDDAVQAGVKICIWKNSRPEKHNPKEEFESVLTDNEGRFCYGRLTAGKYGMSHSNTIFKKVSLSSGEALNLGTIRSEDQ
jgi:hypothetical protein